MTRAKGGRRRLKEVLEARTPQQLVERLFNRLLVVGDQLDDRGDESVEDNVVEVAKDDPAFHEQLAAAVYNYFSSNPSPRKKPELTRHLLELAQQLALANAFPQVQEWFLRHADALARNDDYRLGWAALGALAVSQPRGIAAHRDFWLRQWRKGPDTWAPRSFAGLRLQSPETAADEIPALVARAGSNAESALYGFVAQPEGRAAVESWLSNAPDGEAKRLVRGVLHGHVPPGATNGPPIRKAMPNIFGESVESRPVAVLAP